MILLVNGLDDACRRLVEQSRCLLVPEQLRFVDGARGSRGSVLRIVQVFAIAWLLNVDVHSVRIRSDRFGRPVLLGFDTHISVSHTSDYLAVVLGDHPVGVDIELQRAMQVGVLDRLFSATESAQIVDDRSFTHAWVRKEAYAKWTGFGLGEYLASGIYQTSVGSFEVDRLFVGYAGLSAPLDHAAVPFSEILERR